MASLGSVLVDVIADVSPFEDSLTKAVENSLNKNVFVKGMSAGAAAGVSAVIAEFVPLERAILEIFQVSGQRATQELVQSVSNSVLGVANEIGKPAAEVGNAIAQGVARGFDLEESIDLTRVAGDLAVGLGEAVGPATVAIAGAVNAFGEEILSVEEAAGSLFQVSNLTGTSLKELAQQIGNAAPDAAAAGIAFEEMGGAIATMTQNGQTAAEATTQLRTLINALTDQNSIAGKSFKEISGKTFPEFIKAGGTLADTVDLIDQASKKTGISTRTLTGDINSNRAVLSLTGAGYERFLKNTRDVAGGQEDLADAVDTANQGFRRQLEIGTANFRNGIGAIGIALRPVIDAIGTEFAGVLTSIGGILNNVSQRLQNVDMQALADNISAGVDRVKAILAPLGDFFLSVFNLIAGLDWVTIGNSIKTFFIPIGAVLQVIANGFGLLARAITAVTPTLQQLFSFISPLLPVLAGMAGAFASVGVGLVAFSGIVVTFLAVGAKLLTLFNLLRGAWFALGVAFRANPIGAVVTAVTLLATGLYLAWQNSETFRKGAVAAFNAVKDAAVTGAQFMVHAAAAFFDFHLAGIEKILRAAGKLPKWAGGGAFDSAADAVAGMRAGIQSLVNKVDDLARAAKNADIHLRSALAASEALAESAAQQGLWFGNADTDAALREALSGTGGGSRFSANTGGLADLFDKDSKKAASDAKQISDRLKDMLEGIFESVTDLAKDVGKKSVDQIQSAFDGIVDRYQDAIEFATENGRKSVAKNLKASLKDIMSFDKQLTKLAKKREGVDESLKLAKQELEDINNESLRFEASMRAAFINIGSVAEASAGIGVTFRGIRNNLRDAISTTRLFSDAMTQLRNLDLNETSLRQLADAGPAALDQARALARSGAAGVAEINKLQAELDKLATTNADKLEDEFFNAGQASAKGFVKGLQSQRDAIATEMEKIAKRMVSTIKKELKISSPSGVFADEVGAQIPAGTAKGVRNGIPELIAAIQQMSAASVNATNFGPGSVQVNGVSDPAAATRAGILAGEGIQSVLNRRNTASRLAGV